MVLGRPTIVHVITYKYSGQGRENLESYLPREIPRLPELASGSTVFTLYKLETGYW